MGCVRGKIGLTGQFDLQQPGNYLQPCVTSSADHPITAMIVSRGTPFLKAAEVDTACVLFGLKCTVSAIPDFIFDLHVLI